MIINYYFYQFIAINRNNNASFIAFRDFFAAAKNIFFSALDLRNRLTIEDHLSFRANPLLFVDSEKTFDSYLESIVF